MPKEPRPSCKLPNTLLTLAMLTAVLALGSCGGDDGAPPAPPDEVERISTDAELLELVMQTEPFAAYTLFPDVDSIFASASGGHAPDVRVSLNAKALGTLESGTLPAGATFPDSSIVFKEISSSGATTFYAVMYKDRDNPLAANGWLWGEYRTNGSPVGGGVMSRGSGCVPCHSLQDGPENDLVRTFERQNGR